MNGLTKQKLTYTVKGEVGFTAVTQSVFIICIFHVSLILEPHFISDLCYTLTLLSLPVTPSLRAVPAHLFPPPH